MKKRALALLLSLLLMLPLTAAAETAASPNMATIAIDNIFYTENGAETALPISLEFSAGFDPAAMRGAALLNLLTGGNGLTLMGSLESDQLRARISGMETGVMIPLQALIDELVIAAFLKGLDYSQVRPETLTALDELLSLLEETLMQPAEAASDAFSALQPGIEEWKETYAKYPSLLNAEPAGEEEIVLFGTTYTAQKYTYSLSRATADEFDAFYANYDEYFGYSPDDSSEAFLSPELQEAYDRLNELVSADYEAVYGQPPAYNEIWTDDGSFSYSEESSLSEWNEEQPDDYAYSVEGAIWLADEVMGIVDQYDFTVHAPDGDYPTASIQSMMLNSSIMRDETVSSGMDEYGDRFSSTESTSVTFSDNGDASYTSFSSYVSDSEDDDYDYSSESIYSISMTGNRLVIDVQEEEEYWDTPMRFSLHSDLDVETDAETNSLTALSGSLSISDNFAGDGTGVRMDLSMETGTLPPGELLPLPERTVNPMEADAETMSAFYEEFYAALMQIIGSLMPAPATAPSVGGALMS